MQFFEFYIQRPGLIVLPRVGELTGQVGTEHMTFRYGQCELAPITAAVDLKTPVRHLFCCERNNAIDTPVIEITIDCNAAVRASCQRLWRIERPLHILPTEIRGNFFRCAVEIPVELQGHVRVTDCQMRV